MSSMPKAGMHYELVSRDGTAVEYELINASKKYGGNGPICELRRVGSDSEKVAQIYSRWLTQGKRKGGATYWREVAA